MRELAAAATEPALPAQPPRPRLEFIDLARAVAILMMLQGHFIDVTLAETWRHSPFHTFWNHFRGLAAPMFFASTGLIFVYLLTANATGPLLSLVRVRKGFQRSLQLVCLGYLLQLNLLRIPEYFRSGPDQWLAAFHVLQCIGLGILLLIGVFAIQRRVPRIPLALCYIITGLGLSFLNIWLISLPAGAFFPNAAPPLVQNVFKGPTSIFPLTPWLVFTLYGAALGALVRKWPGKVKGAWPMIIVLGFALKYSGQYIDAGLAAVCGFLTGHPMTAAAWVHDRAGEILALLGILIFVETRFALAGSWVPKVGKNTLPIYFIHVVLLYGGITGIGLRNFMERSLNPWQAALGAVAFMGLFIALGLWIEKARRRAR